MKIISGKYVKDFEKINQIYFDLTGLNLSFDKEWNEQGLDSLDSVELLMNVEREYNIQIDDETAEKLSTPKDLVVYLINLNK